MDAQRFQDRLEDYVGGSASPAEIAELEQMLSAQPNLRRALVERFLLEVHLRKAFAGSVATTPLVQPSRVSRRAILAWLALAAAVLLAVGLSIMGFLGRRLVEDEGANPAPTPANQVVSGKVSVDGTAVQQLPIDKWFEVASDSPAVIRLMDGSSMELTASTRARLPARSDRQGVELGQGTGRFKVTSGLGAFRVETGLGSVTALGTEFSVKLEPRGRGESKRARNRLVLSVSVSEGSVRVDADGRKTVLRAGENRVFGRREREDDD